jgi:hypothetical protein
MKNIIGVYNPFGLIQKAGKGQRRTYKKKKSHSKKTRKNRRK